MKPFHVFFFFLLLATAAGAQTKGVTLSGQVKDANGKTPLPYVNVVLQKATDSAFVAGTVSGGEGRFTLPNIPPGDYLLVSSFTGYATRYQPLFVGSLSEFLDLAVIELTPGANALNEITVTARQEGIGAQMDKKTFSVAGNIAQSGGSVLQAMQNLPGVAVQEGKVQLRGSENITVLIDGKQTALTGFGSQTGLDNLPASAVDKIEIINNPSARYEANGNAGIINIILKKNRQQGLNGKAGLSVGAGSLWQRKENLPGIRPQYRFTPKINPSFSLNYRREKLNLFVGADNLYTQTLNKNEYVTRTYTDGTVINQQLKRNRNTNFFTGRAGLDWNLTPGSTVTVSGLFGSEKIIDRGDQPFFNSDFTKRQRLWQFLEDELKTTVMATTAFQHRFQQPGHLLQAGFTYTFHREDEKYFFDNILPTSSGKDAFALLSDEHVADLNADYIRPLKHGRIEGGLRFRYRNIPTNMQFFPGLNSPIDSNAGGQATYKETIPALYGTYVFENKNVEAELGLRLEYVRVQYQVNPNHNTYKSDGYRYTQPFPNLRFAYKFNGQNKISLFFNRRVDRPNEVDIRIFPKYDDAEIIKVGNPALQPQFTNNLELGYKTTWPAGYVYAAAYHKFASGTIIRIASTAPGSPLIYAIFQNAGKSSNTGLEAVYQQALSARYTLNINLNGYYNRIAAFSVRNLYPVPNTFSAAEQTQFSGNVKVNNQWRLANGLEAQLTAIYLAPDILPQGRIGERFSLDAGLKKTVQKGNGEWFANVSDLFNTLVIQRDIQGDGFRYRSRDYLETQVVRIGYTRKF